MATLNVATFSLAANGEVRQLLYLRHDNSHQLYDLKIEQDFFLRRVVLCDPKSFVEWKSTIYIATIPLGMLPRFIEMIYETMGGLLDGEIDYVEATKALAGSMTIMQEGSCAALLCLEDLLLEQVLRLQLQILARLMRAEDLPDVYEETSLCAEDLSETVKVMMDINREDSPTLGQFDSF